MQQSRALHAGPQTAELKLAITGGTTRRVQLRTTPPDGALVFKRSQLAVGPVAIGTPVTTNAELVNRGTTDTAFRVVSSPHMTCEPASGTVPAGDTAAIALTFACDTDETFSSTVQIERRGGGVAKLSVTAAPTRPEVSLRETLFDFGKLYQGGHGKLPLTLVNRSQVPATVALDLRDRPAFRAAISKDDWSGEEYVHCPLAIAGQPRGMSASTSLARMGSGCDPFLTFSRHVCT